jgi:hypothetical protein
MKKKIFIGFAALAVAAVAAWNVYLASAQSNNEMSDLMLANVEALAEGEDGGSNNSGTGNIYYYTHKLGDPKECTLYKQVNASGQVEYTDSNASLGAGWTVSQVSGIQETCPKSGNGCTVYSCHQTTNTQS